MKYSEWKALTPEQKQRAFDEYKKEMAAKRTTA